MSYDPERITFFAKTDARGKETPFGIKAKDRTRHVYVIGKTGMGKSTLLENMAVQDIRNGEGFAFIDPHGQTAETLLDYIPPERIKDVLYFAPHDIENPVSFNVMEDVGPDKRHLVVSGLMSVFKKIWVDAWSGRMEYILSNTLLALLEYPDATLLGVNRMLSDSAYRKKVVDNVTDPSVKSFWVDEFAKYSERYMQEAGDAIKNKIGQFTANPLIRNIIGQPRSSFDIRKIMDERKILIMNLSKGLVGETNANLLGSMLTTRIYLAAMSRADLTPAEIQEKPNFYFYVDEFQSFANATFANILSEARKYKLNLTIAHQYIEQMEEDVRNAVFGNVGTTITFRVGPFDAEILETVYAPKFTATDLVNLGFAQVYLTLMIDGIGSPPFSAATLPPLEARTDSYKDLIENESRRQFAKPRAEVEDAINTWHAPLEKEKTKSVSKSDEKAPYAENESRPISARSNTTPSRTSDGDGAGHTSSASHSAQTRREGNDRNKTVTDKRDEKPARNLTNSNPANSKPTSPPPSKADYKSRDELRDILKNIASQEEKSEKEQEPKTKDTNASLKRALGEVLNGKDAPVEKREHHKDTPQPNAAKKPDLDPKRLERMMRVKTDDRTPLR